jgi:hypothetical protein
MGGPCVESGGAWPARVEQLAGALRVAHHAATPHVVAGEGKPCPQGHWLQLHDKSVFRAGSSLRVGGRGRGHTGGFWMRFSACAPTMLDSCSAAYRSGRNICALSRQREVSLRQSRGPTSRRSAPEPESCHRPHHPRKIARISGSTRRSRGARGIRAPAGCGYRPSGPPFRPDRPRDIAAAFRTEMCTGF